MKTIFIYILVFISAINISAQIKKEPIVLIETNLGNIKVKLYNETPQHRDNFIKLAATKFYDNLLFHRVIKDFMIQGGDPASKNASKDASLGSGGPGYTIPAEINVNLIHKKGAIAAARQGDNVNPKKASSGSQFYIVQGRKASDEQLNQIESTINNSRKLERIKDLLANAENKKIKDELIKYQKEKNSIKFDSIQKILDNLVNKKYPNESLFKYSPQQREIYKTIGGTPFLDMNYTVFGEVIEGFDIIDKISAVKTIPGDRPEEDVRIITIKIIK
jgi:cyclophilin family peptidyl-prolyl cis-trans isomerase